MGTTGNKTGRGQYGQSKEDSSDDRGPLRCKNWKELKKIAFQLSTEGYGVQIIGFRDMDETVLTIAALPERELHGRY